MLSEHYLGPMKGPILTYALGTPARDALAIFKPPMAVQFNAALPRPLELSRLWRAGLPVPNVAMARRDLWLDQADNAS